MESPWEANWFAVSQEIPRISRNPKVHFRTHNSPPPVPVLGQPNLVHIPTSHLLEPHPNIIRPSTSRSPQRFLSLRFPYQDPIRPPLLTHMRHMPSPSHSSRFYHPPHTHTHTHTHTTPHTHPTHIHTHTHTHTPHTHTHTPHAGTHAQTRSHILIQILYKKFRTFVVTSISKRLPAQWEKKKKSMNDSVFKI